MTVIVTIARFLTRTVAKSAFNYTRFSSVVTINPFLFLQHYREHPPIAIMPVAKLGLSAAGK